MYWKMNHFTEILLFVMWILQQPTIYPAQSISAKTCGDQIELFISDPIPNIEDRQKEHFLKLMRCFFRNFISLLHDL